MPTYQWSVESSSIDSRQLPDFGLDYSRQGSVNSDTMITGQQSPSTTAAKYAVDLRKTPLLSMQEAAHILGVSTDTLYRLIGHNKLRTIKIGKRRLVTPWALQEYLDIQEQISRLGGNYGF